MFTPRFQEGRFLTLGSAAASAVCTFQERGNCFQTEYRNCEVPQLYCRSLHSGTLSSVLTLIHFCPFCVVEVHSAFPLPFSSFFSLMTANMYCCKAFPLSTWLRGWRGYNHKRQSSCSTDWPVNPGLVLRITTSFWQDYASAAPLGHRSSATCPLFGSFWSATALC